MSVPVTELQYEGETLFSPFTGDAADTGVGEADESVLFVYYGDVGLYSVFSERVRESATEAGIDDPEGTEPNQLLQRLNVPGAVAFRIDAGWNGINYYAFAPGKS